MAIIFDLVKVLIVIVLALLYLYRMKLFIVKYIDNDWELISYPTIVILLAILIPGFWRFVLLIRSIIRYWKDR